MHSSVRVLPLALYVTLLLPACGEHGVSGSPASQPSDFADELRARSPVDLDPDPNVLEIELEARVADIEFIPGAPTTAWTYDGGVPGPLIRAKVGDRVRVHFKNSLPEPTSIHWHGLRIPMAMDGVPEHGQAPVPPGGSFDYEFTLPDAGTFWYHPHFASAAQVGNGLYGPLIVDDPNEPRGIGDEVVLMLSDIALNPDGTLIAGDAGGDEALLAGREGSLLLVNGRVNPTLRAADGLRQRFRLINAAKTRYFDLALDAHDFLRIGGDGGLIAAPERTSALLLVPGERADVVVTPTRERATDGRAPSLRSLEYRRGPAGRADYSEHELIRLDLRPVAGEPSSALPALARDVRALDPTSATPIDLFFTMNAGDDGNLAPRIEVVPSSGSHVQARVGEHQLWSVTNLTEWDHPFHLHGFFFQLLDVDGVVPAVREWKDTVNVRSASTVRLLVHFDERPGMWMFHCHILDHADHGMMGMVDLR
jgi:FtsP/CotA-like multicopper oxidase with cupredoxin domain